MGGEGRDCNTLSTFKTGENDMYAFFNDDRVMIEGSFDTCWRYFVQKYWDLTIEELKAKNYKIERIER